MVERIVSRESANNSWVRSKKSARWNSEGLKEVLNWDFLFYIENTILVCFHFFNRITLEFVDLEQIFKYLICNFILPVRRQLSWPVRVNYDGRLGFLIFPTSSLF